MRKIAALLIVFTLSSILIYSQKQPEGKEIKQIQSPQNPRIGFVIHGGAGVISRGSMTPEKEAAYRKKLEEALMAGYKALQEGKTAIDAVEIAIKILEDSPLFNAGKGAVFTADGKIELDASIMDGKTLKAGAVAAVHTVKNPISLARAVMEKSPHVMLIGEGAEKFASQQGLEIVDPKYFWTQERWDQYQRIKKEHEMKEKNFQQNKTSIIDQPNNKFGTVGAVALDKYGNLAAGTSTGGMAYKMYGRVGDTPIIGAGTYANNDTCAVSATGWGEYFIRLSVAKDISALMEYRALPIQEAVDLVIQKKLKNLGGDGGVIAIDKFGNIGISFNSEGMYRAYINSEGKPVVMIYKDE
ncbi:MAG: isoaspartyl peptidase/L-asparaginase [Acidobacteria bacterium]|nr:MAG: isoaspartyl peptidase/L-asparaginase [Acidobacteriota bacterium]